MLNTYEKHSQRKLIATILLIVVIAGAVVFADHLKASTSQSNLASAASHATSPAQTTAPTPSPTTSQPTTTTSSAPTTTPSATPTTTTSNASGYKDGTYSVTSSYYVPHGNEHIQVNLTLSSGTITNASIKNSQGDDVSAYYQNNFADAYKSYVVGKKISGLQLGVIAGASDTTQGFNDALSQIISKAQA